MDIFSVKGKFLLLTAIDTVKCVSIAAIFDHRAKQELVRIDANRGN